MKDAKGHGSNVRAGTEHQALLARQHGVGGFGKRATIPTLPSKPSRFGQLVSEFGKSESGEGVVPAVFRHGEQLDPDAIGNVAEAAASGISEGRLDLSHLVHFAKFLAFLGSVAVIDLIAQGLMK